MFASLKTRVRAVALGAVIALGLTPAMAQEVVTVGAFPDPGYDAIFWALENGKVSDPGATLKIERVSSIPALIQASMTQQFNLIPDGALAIPRLRESGVMVEVVATMMRFNPEGNAIDLWVTADSPIQTVEDLKGKTVAVVSAELPAIVYLRWAMAERHGMNADTVGGDVNWVEMPPAQFETALETGKVDAVNFINADAYTLPMTGKYRSVIQGAKEVDEMFGAPMPGLFMLGYENELEARPEAYAAAARILAASAKYFVENSQEVADIVAPQYNMSAEDLIGWFNAQTQMPMTLSEGDKVVLGKAWETAVKFGELEAAPGSVDAVIAAAAIIE